MKVLIVEGDSAIAANLYDYLEAGGYEVDVAEKSRVRWRLSSLAACSRRRR